MRWPPSCLRRRMWQDPRFSFGARARWAALRSGPWSDAVITQMVADVSALIRPAVLRNFDRYAAVLLKPWYSSAEQEWTTGGAECLANAALAGGGSTAGAVGRPGICHHSLR